MRSPDALLSQEYAEALREYLAGGGESALLRAYQVGRRFVAAGTGVLELAAIHQQGVVRALLELTRQEEQTQLARHVSEFFAEALAPFEMSQRGFRETNAVLRELNRELEDRVSARTQELEKTLQEFRSTQAELDENRRLERMKNEFISIVSHELRTPLASIHGSLSLLRSGVGGELGARTRQLVEIAYRNSERLVRLVNDVLDLRRIETGSLALRLAPLEVLPVLEQAVEVNQAFAAQLGVTLVLEGVPGAMVHADGDLLVQVLTNLLANAARFSPPDEKVVTSLEVRDSVVRVSVSDRGPGVPEDFRSHVFERFAQADNQTARTKGGSGLGLSIAKAIVERLGGRIGFESEPGHGATFFFELPEWRRGGLAGEEEPCREN